MSGHPSRDRKLLRVALVVALLAVVAALAVERPDLLLFGGMWP